MRQHWVAPLLLMVLTLPVLVLLPWQSQKNEVKDHQDQLIAETLWVEQDIRVQLLRNEENLHFLGEAFIAKSISKEQLKEKMTLLKEHHPELRELIWLDANEHVLFSTSPFQLSDDSLLPTQSAQQARLTGLARYSEPTIGKSVNTGMVMDFRLPLFIQKEYLGSLVMRYQLTGILTYMVPWWFAKDNQISLCSSDGIALAQRFDNGMGQSVYAQSRKLELPGVNLILKTNSVKGESKLLSKYLIIAVLLLGTTLLWSLWALRGDVLRRNRAETDLKGQIAFRRAMEESLVTGLRVRGLDGKLLYVNSAFCSIVGYSEEQLVGLREPLPFWGEEAIESYKRLPLLTTADSVTGFETVYIRSDGRRIPVLVNESALMNENGLQTGWMGSILDISERKNSERILREGEEKLRGSIRLLTMGEMASVLAHELNQPLTAISSYASGTLSMVNSSKGIDRDMLNSALSQMQIQAQRAGQIIRSVHDFIAKREPKRVSMQLSDVFGRVMPLIELQASSYLIWLQIKLEDGLPNVFVDSVSIEQVILNLTRNALQSMQKLTTSKRMLQIEVKRIPKYVEVEVTDFGTGIDRAVAEKLFSPFFSTKADGMGMGLNICRTIIEFHGGNLTYRPNPEGGTIFSFTLPIVDN